MRDSNDDARHGVSRADAESAVRTLLRWAGEDPEREGLLDTPRRVAEAYGEWFGGYAIDPDAYLARTFEEVEGYDLHVGGGAGTERQIARLVRPKVAHDELPPMVLNLLRAVQARSNLAMLFITHDLRVAGKICDRVAVMQKGRIVELGPVEQVFRNPREHYTQSLLAAAPGLELSGQAAD